jgi:hypothetical protein
MKKDRLEGRAVILVIQYYHRNLVNSEAAAPRFWSGNRRHTTIFKKKTQEESGRILRLRRGIAAAKEQNKILQEL